MIELSEEEKKQAEHFKNTHACSYITEDFLPRSFTIKSEPCGGIGMMVEIQCNHCGTTIDITDVGVW